jgi:uroporphyrinogen decarboxylase
MKIAPFIGSPARVLTGTTIRRNLTDAAVQLETLHAVQEEFDPDIVFTFMNLSAEAEALGLKLDFPEDRIPTVTEHPADSEESLQKIFRKKLATGMMNVHVEAARRFKETSRRELGAYITGPFSLTGILMDVGRAAMNVLLKPGLVLKSMELSAEMAVAHARELEKAGADYIILLEPTAVILSPEQFRKFVVPFLNEIFSTLKKKTVLHICGKSSHLLEEAAGIRGLFAMSLDTHVDLREARRILGKHVMGNISPALIAGGTRNEIGEAVTTLAEQMRGMDEFILSSGCDLPPETPRENILHFMRVSREHRE